MNISKFEPLIIIDAQNIIALRKTYSVNGGIFLFYQEGFCDLKSFDVMVYVKNPSVLHKDFSM